MLLWVLMDIGDYVPELSIGSNRHATKGILEQAAGPAVGFVDGLGVGIEEIGEAVADVMGP
jgi:hypothetical protein